VDRQRPPIGLAALTVFRADGRRLATTGPNGDLKVWDTAEPRKPQLLVRLTRRHRVLAAAWNPTAADLIGTLATDATVSVWRVVDDRPPQELVRLALPSGRHGALTWLSDGRHIVCAGDDGLISLWDLVAGGRDAEVLGDASPCLAVHAGPEGELRAVHQDGTIRRPGERTMHLQPVTAAAWSLPGGSLAVARDYGSIEVRDASLRTRWARELGTTPLLPAWHGDDAVVAADRSARTLTALDAVGRRLWQTRLAIQPASLAAAAGLIAVSGHNYAPEIFELERGALLSGALA
jgi:WD domain, G-beta repeat